MIWFDAPGLKLYDSEPAQLQLGRVASEAAKKIQEPNSGASLAWLRGRWQKNLAQSG